MDQTSPSERNFVVDLESGGGNIMAPGSTDLVLDCAKLESTFFAIVSKDVEVARDNVKLLIDKKLEGVEGFGVGDKKTEKANRKKTSGKKAPKPPRPPRGPSLDAADQKLIKEISEFAMIKRARIERMKALKKMKAMKASSSSSNGNLFATLFTVLFCFVVIFQGFSPQKSSPVSSSELAQATERGFISVHSSLNPSAFDTSIPGSVSPNLVQSVSGSDSEYKVSRASG